MLKDRPQLPCCSGGTTVQNHIGAGLSFSYYTSWLTLQQHSLSALECCSMLDPHSGANIEGCLQYPGAVGL